MSTRIVTPEVLYEYKWVSEPAVHPSGSSAAYVCKGINQEKNNYASHIRLVSIDGEKDVQLTDGLNDSSPIWSPDGKQLGFLRVTDEGKQVWTVSVDGRTVKQLTHAKRGVGSFAWSPDGSQLLYSSKVSMNKERECLSLLDDRKHEDRHGQKYDRSIPKAEGAGWWDGLYTHVFVLKLASGEIAQLTSGAFHASQPAWSPDGLSAAFLAKMIDDPSIDADLIPINDIYTVSLQNRRVKKITDSSLVIAQFSYSPDGRSLAIIGGSREYGSGTQSQLYSVSAEGGEPEVLHPPMDIQLGNYILNDMQAAGTAPGPLFSTDGQDVYALGTYQGEAHLYRFRKGTAPVQISRGELDIYQIAAAGDGRYIVAAAVNAAGPGELVRVDTRDGASQTLTGHNNELMAQLNTSKAEALLVDTKDGFSIHGWIMCPPDLKAGEKVPLVLVIHGGPHAMYAPVYSHELQMLAAQGYAVLFANPRGSFGYGQAFAKACRGDFGNGDYEDLMAVVDAAIARYDFVDDARLGVMGGSYGGLMTNWIVSHTNRFKAAVTQRSITNWVSFYGLSDIGISYTEGIAGGNPWDQHALLWERSPIAHVEHIDTPLLIMHGEQDLRCPVSQADELYTALKRLGKRTRLLRYPGSNHGFLKVGKPSYRVDALNEVNVWLKEHLHGE